MLQEILALNDSLFRAGHTAESLYQQKLDIITNNIYGANKDGLAVSTAMLRLWLSLAVDYDGDGPPDPLPNLDLKLVVGDAIAGPNPQQFDLTLASIVNSGLRDDIAAYTTSNGQQKVALKQRVDATKAQLRSNLSRNSCTAERTIDNPSDGDYQLMYCFRAFPVGSSWPYSCFYAFYDIP